MTPEALAALHAAAFPGPPRPWTVAEFEALTTDPTIRILSEGILAFVVLRLAGPEAEILTLCTTPEAQRTGLATRLMTRAEEMARAAGADTLFLEVAETNSPARALYANAGFTERGYRKNYYQASGRAAVSARVLAKQLD